MDAISGKELVAVNAAHVLTQIGVGDFVITVSVTDDPFTATPYEDYLPTEILETMLLAIHNYAFLHMPIEHGGVCK